MKKPLVGIIMGSDSDLPIMQEAAITLKKFDISYELTIVSAHRTPERMFHYATSASKRGLLVIIAGAGGSAHLPGMVASLTTVPVIGIPIKGKYLEGMDSLLSIVQMPPGIPVAVVAINGAQNAALLALKIIASANKDVQKKLEEYQRELEETVNTKAEKLEKIGFTAYIRSLQTKH